MVWYLIPALISLAGLLLALAGAGVLPGACSGSGGVRWGRLAVGTTICIGALLAGAGHYLVRESLAQNRFAQVQTHLEESQLDQEIPDFPALLRHEDSNSATNYRQIAQIFGSHPDTLSALENLRLIGRDSPARDDISHSELLVLPGIEPILEELESAAEKVQFWHASAMLAGETAAGDPLPTLPQTIQMSGCLLLVRAESRIGAEEIPAAYEDIHRALQLSSHLCGSRIYWQRKAGENLLNHTLKVLEKLGATGQMPTEGTLTQLRESLQFNQPMKAFDESVLRSLLNWNAKIPQEIVELSPSVAVTAAYMPLDNLELPWLISRTELRAEVLTGISQLHDQFHQQPTTLARANLLNHLEPVIARTSARELARQLELFQNHVVELETRRRLAEAAVVLYTNGLENPDRFLQNPQTQLQTLPREILLHPRTFALLQVNQGTGKPSLSFGEPQDDVKWQLASVRDFTGNARESGEDMDPPKNRDSRKGGIAQNTPEVEPDPRRAKLLTAARLLQAQKKALTKRKPDPATATAEDLAHWQDDMDKWQTQAARLKEAAQRMR